MKSLTDSAIQVLNLAAEKDQYVITPDMLDDTEKHSMTPHDSRVGYLGRLCKSLLLEKTGDPKLEQYALTPYGLWVVHMYKKGWKFTDRVWSRDSVAIDDETANQCYVLNIVPIVSSLLEN